MFDIPHTLGDEWVWGEKELPNPPDDRWPLAVVWTGSKLMVWGGTLADNNVTTILYDGFSYDPLEDSWSPLTSDGAPVNNWGASVVWTGSEMIVWGGTTTPGVGQILNTGGVYNPRTESWRPMTLSNAPSARVTHTTVWTGTEMIVWGGHGDGGDAHDAAAYDPATDSWRTISTVNAPHPTSNAVVVWTGTEMITWSGYFFVADGFSIRAVYPLEMGRYNPKADSWNTQILPDSPDVRMAGGGDQS